MTTIKLRKYDHTNDAAKLRQFLNDNDNLILSFHTLQPQDFPMFERELCEKACHELFMIDECTNDVVGNTIGFIFSYEYAVYEGHCKIAWFFYEEYKDCGFDLLAAVKMMDHLFSNFPLSRIFTSVYDYNKNGFNNIKNNLLGRFQEVGCLPNYKFFNGNYHSLHLLTMSRDAFYERYKR